MRIQAGFNGSIGSRAAVSGFHGSVAAAYAGFALGLAMVGAGPVAGQSRPATPGLPTLPSGVPANSREDYDIPGNDPVEQQRLLRALNAERQKRVIADSNKLIKLTTELNAEVTQTNADTLTSAQLHTVAKIEQLARDLKERLNTAWQPTRESQIDPRLRR